MSYAFGGHSDVGYKRELNEDHIAVSALDDDTVLAIIADGAGSKASTLQPAQIAAGIVADAIQRSYAKNRKAVLSVPDIFLLEAMHAANRCLGAFKIANEELYAGFASSMSCVLLTKDTSGDYPRSAIAFAHIGNTRLYLIRVTQDGVPSIRQLTKDQTEAQKLVDDHLIDSVQYHVHPDRLVITGALGFVTEPQIQTFRGYIRADDYLLLTTDGIHYAIQPTPMMQIVLASTSCEDACRNLTRTSVAQGYNDNCSSILIHALPD